ncbi:MAG: YdeI/OmpD-associated family protein [Dehalococcoidia bacterium]
MASRRPVQPIPDDVTAALDAESLFAVYEARPFYQRNDYLGWITRAKRAATREKRLRQMLDELRAGGVYMGMEHAPSRSDARG